MIEPAPLASQLAPDVKVVYAKYCGGYGGAGQPPPLHAVHAEALVASESAAQTGMRKAAVLPEPVRAHVDLPQGSQICVRPISSQSDAMGLHTDVKNLA